jgi:hypothetical protein
MICDASTRRHVVGAAQRGRGGGPPARRKRGDGAGEAPAHPIRRWTWRGMIGE